MSYMWRQNALGSCYWRVFTLKRLARNQTRVTYFLLNLFMNHFPVRGQEGQVYYKEQRQKTGTHISSIFPLISLTNFTRH